MSDVTKPPGVGANPLSKGPGPVFKEIRRTNRMIKLFQTKADVAYEKFVQARHRLDHENPADPQTVKEMAFSLFAEYRTWTKAAELLRKEELNK